MWFREGTFAGLGTDAWLFNYAVGIGSTQFPSGTRLAAGQIQITEDTVNTPNLNVDGHTELDQLRVSGVSTFTGSISFPDSSGDTVGRALFGDSDDLRIYHDGSNSIIQEVGAGDLRLAGNIVKLNNGSNTATMVKATDGGSVELNHNGTKRLETTSYGVKIYDDVRVGTGVTIYGNAGIVSAISFYGDGSNLTNTGATLSATSGVERLVTTQLTSGTMVDAATDADLTFDAGTNTLNTQNIKISGGISTNGSAYGQDGQLLQSTGTGWQWRTVPGLYSVNNILNGFNVLEEGSTVGTAGSIHTLDFRGINVTATADPAPNGIATVTFSPTPSFTTVDVDDDVTVGAGLTVNGRIVGAATSNVIPFLYDTLTDLPSAGTYHGAFAHVHATGKAYYAHAGAWIELVNKELNGNVKIGTGITMYASTGIISATKFYGDGSNLLNTGATLNPASGTQRLVLTNLTSGTMVDAATDSDLTYDAISDKLNVVNLDITGITTLGGPVTAGSSEGVVGQYLRHVGTGVTWANFPTLRTTQTNTATAGQTAFNFSYNVDFLDVFVNGVKLSPSEYTATNGNQIVLNTPAFANEVVEFHSYNITSNYGGGGGGGGASNLDGLTDVTIGTLTDKDLLQYQASSGEWENVPVTSVTPAGISTTGTSFFNVIDTPLPEHAIAVIGAGGTISHLPNFTYENGTLSVQNTGSSGSGDLNVAGEVSSSTLSVSGNTTLTGNAEVSTGRFNIGVQGGYAATITNAGVATFSGSVTAPEFFGDGSNLTGVVTSLIGKANVTISDNPPGIGTAHGDLWWESDTAKGHIYYNDGSSSQWVEFSPSSGGGGGGGGGGSYANSDVDNHLNVASASAGEVLSWNGSDYDWVAQSGIALTNLSVTTAGTPLQLGALAYNNTNGVFTFTPPDIEGQSRQALSVGTANNPLQIGAISYDNGTGVFTYTPPDLSSYQQKTGDGSALTGIVTSIVAGTNVTVSNIGGAYTINSSGGSSGISNVVDDTTPQLGGNLDLNSNNITGNGNITINGTASITGSSIQLIDNNNNDTYIKMTSGITSISHPAQSVYPQRIATTNQGIDIFKDVSIKDTNNTEKFNFNTGSGTLTADFFSGDGSNLTNVSAGATDLVSTYNLLNTSTTSAYFVDGPGITDTTDPNPTIYLTRGQTYKFNNNAGSHPFRIQYQHKTISGAIAYNDGIPNNQVGNGATLYWEVPFDAPDVLFYQCSSHINMSGKIVIMGDVVSEGSWTAAAGTPQTIDTITGVANNAIKTAEYTIHIENGSNMQAQKVFVMQDGTTAFSQEYAIMHKSGLLVSMSATISGGNLLLQATPETGVSGTTTYKVTRQTMR